VYKESTEIMNSLPQRGGGSSEVSESCFHNSTCRHDTDFYKVKVVFLRASSNDAEIFK